MAPKSKSKAKAKTAGVVRRAKLRWRLKFKQPDPRESRGKGGKVRENRRAVAPAPAPVRDKVVAQPVPQIALAEPTSKRIKSDREVQVMLNCTDYSQGFVRSVTARHLTDVEKLRQKLLDLKARAKHEMTYQAVKEELQALRVEFARHQGGGLANLARKSEPKGHRKPLQEAAGAEAKEATAGDEVQQQPHRKRKTAARKAAGSAKALELKRQGKGLFAEKKASPQLAKLIGKSRVTHTEASKLMWRYIKERGLQNGRFITADRKLKQVCPEETFTMFQLHQFLKTHLS